MQQEKAVEEVKEVDTSRCTGHCCEDVGLYVGPEELKTQYYRWIESGHYHGRDYRSPNASAEDPYANDLCVQRDYARLTECIHLLYPMLVFTHEDREHPDRPGAPQDRRVYHYRCKHFDQEKRACSIYEIRPFMCRQFGTDGCGYKGCTWKSATDKRMDELKSRLKSTRWWFNLPDSEKERARGLQPVPVGKIEEIVDAFTDEEKEAMKKDNSEALAESFMDQLSKGLKK